MEFDAAVDLEECGLERGGAFFCTGGLNGGLGWGELKMVVLKSFGLLAAGQDRIRKLFKRRASDRRHKWICSVVQKPARLDV